MPELSEPTHLRGLKERCIQTAAYEIGGLLVIAPLFALFTKHDMKTSTAILVAVSLAFVVWTFIHNLAFDMIEQRLGGGPASKRSHPWRLVHAVSLEVGSIIVTLPILIYAAGFSFWNGVFVDVALSVAYAAYAYVFHLGFDRLRPVGAH